MHNSSITDSSSLGLISPAFAAPCVMRRTLCSPQVRGPIVVHEYFNIGKPAVDAEGWFATGGEGRGCFGRGGGGRVTNGGMTRLTAPFKGIDTSCCFDRQFLILTCHCCCCCRNSRRVQHRQAWPHVHH